MYSKEDSVEKDIKVQNKENIDCKTLRIKPLDSVNKVQQRYSKFEEQEPVDSVSKISNKHEDRPSNTSECD
jgi:hypothetical protein